MQLPALDTRESVTARWNATIGAIDVVFGPATRLELPDLVSNAGFARPLLVTDPGVRATGYVDEVAERLRASGADLASFDDPHQYSEGVRYLLVNGRLAVYRGNATGALAGRALAHP